MGVFVDLLICVLGLCLHGCMKWRDYRNTTARLSLWNYLNEVPAQTIVAILSTAVSFLVMYQLGWLNPGMAFGCGYMGNSIADNLGTRFGVLPK